MMAADPADVSVLHMAFYLRSGGGISYLNAFEGGAQQTGSTAAPTRSASSSPARLGDRVRLGEPVARSTRTATRRRCVRCDTDRATYDGRRGGRRGAAAARRRDRLPAGPAGAAGHARTGRGCAVKVHLVYPEPLWRATACRGWSVNAEGPLLSTVDDSPRRRQRRRAHRLRHRRRGAPLRRADRPTSSGEAATGPGRAALPRPAGRRSAST